MVHEKITSSRKNLFTTIKERWNYFDHEYCFKLVKFIPKSFKTEKKISGSGNKVLIHIFRQ